MYIMKQEAVEFESTNLASATIKLAMYGKQHRSIRFIM
jgi:hypothetical protein